MLSEVARLEEDLRRGTRCMKSVGGLLNATAVLQQALAENVSRIPIWTIADDPEHFLQCAKAHVDADVRAVISPRWPEQVRGGEHMDRRLGVEGTEGKVHQLQHGS